MFICLYINIYYIYIHIRFHVQCSALVHIIWYGFACTDPKTMSPMLHRTPRSWRTKLNGFSSWWRKKLPDYQVSCRHLTLNPMKWRWDSMEYAHITNWNVHGTNHNNSEIEGIICSKKSKWIEPEWSLRWFALQPAGQTTSATKRYSWIPTNGPFKKPKTTFFFRRGVALWSSTSGMYIYIYMII